MKNRIRNRSSDINWQCSTSQIFGRCPALKIPQTIYWQLNLVCHISSDSSSEETKDKGNLLNYGHLNAFYYFNSITLNVKTLFELDYFR